MISNKTVLITGGTGFVGYWMEKTKPAPWLDITYLSHKNYDDMEWYLYKWDYIVHLANISPATVIQHALAGKARVLYASSGAAYNQKTEYANNKRTWENECHEELQHKCVVARIFACSGYKLKNYFALTNFIDDAIHGRPITIQGNGKSIRSYIHGSDLGRWLWRILLDGDGLYAVGDTTEYTILDVAKAVASVMLSEMGMLPEIKILDLPDVPQTRYVPFIGRARLELDLQTIIPLKEGIAMTIKQMVEDQVNARG